MLDPLLLICYLVNKIGVSYLCGKTVLYSFVHLFAYTRDKGDTLLTVLLLHVDYATIRKCVFPQREGTERVCTGFELSPFARYDSTYRDNR